VRTRANTPDGFTILELLVVVAILGILASLLLPALSRAKSNMQRATCLNNLAQIGKGVAMYADDFDQVFFPIVNKSEPVVNGAAIYEWTAYNPLMRSYVGLKSAPSSTDKLFACPADGRDLRSERVDREQVIVAVAEILHVEPHGSGVDHAARRRGRSFGLVAVAGLHVGRHG